MRNKLIFATAFLMEILNASCQSKTNPPKNINWYDSTSVIGYLQSSSLCDKVSLIKDSLSIFTAEKGFSLKVLESVSKETHEYISIPIATGNVILTEEYKKESLKDQINAIQKKYCK